MPVESQVGKCLNGSSSAVSLEKESLEILIAKGLWSHSRKRRQAACQHPALFFSQFLIRYWIGYLGYELFDGLAIEVGYEN